MCQSWIRGDYFDNKRYILLQSSISTNVGKLTCPPKQVEKMPFPRENEFKVIPLASPIGDAQNGNDTSQAQKLVIEAMLNFPHQLSSSSMLCNVLMRHVTFSVFSISSKVPKD